MTIIYVTHDPRMAEFAHRLIHIYDGKLANGDGTNPEDGLVDTSKSQQTEPDSSKS
jgi:ABC-type lipoprotein export system ATPase subunit